MDLRPASRPTCESADLVTFSLPAATATLRAALVAVVAVLGAVLAAPHAAADAKPAVGAPVPGIPMPCVAAHAWPANDSLGEIVPQLEKNFAVDLRGAGWLDPANRKLVKIVWQTLDGVSCTDYVATIEKKIGGTLIIKADHISGYAWGDWSLTNPGALTVDLTKWQAALTAGDPGRLVRLTIHEMAHAYNVDRGAEPRYWSTFQALYAQQGKFSNYANNVTETFADAVGYYVGRCALNNPYDEGDQAAYYTYVKTHIFKGREFGPGAGDPVNCSLTTPAAAPSQPTVTVPNPVLTTPHRHRGRDTVRPI